MEADNTAQLVRADAGFMEGLVSAQDGASASDIGGRGSSIQQSDLESSLSGVRVSSQASDTNGLDFDSKTLQTFASLDQKFDGILERAISGDSDLGSSASDIEGLRQQLKSLAGEQDDPSEAAIFQTLRGNLNQARRAAAGNNGFFSTPNEDAFRERIQQTAKSFDAANLELAGIDTGAFTRNPSDNTLDQLGVNRNNFAAVEGLVFDEPSTSGSSNGDSESEPDSVSADPVATGSKDTEPTSVQPSNGDLDFDQETIDTFAQLQQTFDGIFSDVTTDGSPDLSSVASDIEGLRQQLKGLAGEQDNTSEGSIFQTLRGDLNQVRRAAAGGNAFFDEPDLDTVIDRINLTANAFDLAAQELSGVDTGAFVRDPSEQELAQLGVNRNNFSKVGGDA